MDCIVNFSFEELCLIGSLGTNKRKDAFIELQKLYNAKSMRNELKETKEKKNVIRNCIRKLEHLSDSDFNKFDFESIKKDLGMILC